MEHDWEVVDYVEKQKIFDREFRIGQLLDKVNGISAFAVFENDEAVSIFADLESAQKDLLERMIEQDWEILDYVEKQEIFGRKFCIGKVFEKVNNISAFAVFDNDETVGIFTDLESAQKNLLARMTARVDAWKNKEHDWEPVELIDTQEIYGTVYRIFQTIDKNSGFFAYAVFVNNEAVSLFTELENAYKDMHERMRLREIAMDSSHTFGYGEDD